MNFSREPTTILKFTPFFLFRMLIHAMEVSGIEGNFRSTCEWVMRLLRDNKESLMFVFTINSKKYLARQSNINLQGCVGGLCV